MKDHVKALSKCLVHQAPLAIEISRQEYWSGLSYPSPVDFPNPGIEPGSPALEADSLQSELPGKRYSLKTPYNVCVYGCVCVHICAYLQILHV